MLISVTRQSKDGECSDAAVNPRFVTSAVWLEEYELTAVNMHKQPTIWVTETPDEISALIYEGEQNG